METEKLRIRQMTEKDWGAIQLIDKKITGEHRTATWPQMAISHIKTHTPALSFVAEKDDRVVGFLLADLRGAEYALPPAGWIDSVGVDPDYQRQGIGTALIESSIQACHNQGIKTRAMIKEKDKGLQKLLHILGFRRGEFVEYVKGFTI